MASLRRPNKARVMKGRRTPANPLGGVNDW
jgi:hypothetical protein